MTQYMSRSEMQNMSYNLIIDDCDDYMVKSKVNKMLTFKE